MEFDMWPRHVDIVSQGGEFGLVFGTIIVCNPGVGLRLNYLVMFATRCPTSTYTAAAVNWSIWNCQCWVHRWERGDWLPTSDRIRYVTANLGPTHKGTSGPGSKPRGDAAFTLQSSEIYQLCCCVALSLVLTGSRNHKAILEEPASEMSCM
jgi:hypothetical protein